MLTDGREGNQPQGQNLPESLCIVEACERAHQAKLEAKEPLQEFWIKNIEPEGDDCSDSRIWQVVPRRRVEGPPIENQSSPQKDPHVSKLDRFLISGSFTIFKTTT